MMNLLAAGAPCSAAAAAAWAHPLHHSPIAFAAHLSPTHSQPLSSRLVPALGQHKNRRHYRNEQVHMASVQVPGCGDDIKQEKYSPTSFVAMIRSHNLAGMVNDDGSKDIAINLGDKPNLVAITGETGSGKSVLIARVADLVSGGKASPTMVPQDGSTAVAAMDIQLSKPHISMVEATLEGFGVESDVLVAGETEGTVMLSLCRSLSLQTGRKSKRLKSTCEINGRSVTLKTLRAVAAPLLTVVDAAAAAAALSRPNARLGVIDTAVSKLVKTRALKAKNEYRRARRHRESLERELKSQVLPPSYSPGADDEDAIEMLRHWVEELDSFEERALSFRDTAISIDRHTSLAMSMPLINVMENFGAASWFDLSTEAAGVSEYYSQLLELRDVVKDADAQLEAANSAVDLLSSLSSPDSAVTALQRARDSLFDATGGISEKSEEDGVEDTFSAAAEEAHDRLNSVEDALSECVRSLEDPKKGLVPSLEKMKDNIHVSLDDIDLIIADWNTLARKHNISPFSLPSCHRGLRSELDGSVEARTLLPKAKETEENALEDFEYACGELSAERKVLCDRLSQLVTERLPSLGIRSKFEVQLNALVQKCTDAAAYGDGSGLGLDSVDFMLYHEKSSSDSKASSENTINSRGGKLENIGSAGEKARVLLAIETQFPGSVGALCGNGSSATTAVAEDREEEPVIRDALASVPAVAVIYDEIDAHVGGRAAVAVAKLLVDQTRPQTGGQVISITHSPSVAAVADKHVVIQKASGNTSAETSTNPIIVSLVDGTLREQELGRMCGGDLAQDEAEAFAAALLRDGESQRKLSNVNGD